MVLLTVRPVLVNYPSGHHRPSAQDFVDCLSPLLLELCFWLGFIWDLFLGLVGPL
jgi:hypothetical protein